MCFRNPRVLLNMKITRVTQKISIARKKSLTSHNFIHATAIGDFSALDALCYLLHQLRSRKKSFFKHNVNGRKFTISYYKFEFSYQRFSWQEPKFSAPWGIAHCTYNCFSRFCHSYRSLQRFQQTKPIHFFSNFSNFYRVFYHKFVCAFAQIFFKVQRYWSRGKSRLGTLLKCSLHVSDAKPSLLFTKIIFLI